MINKTFPSSDQPSSDQPSDQPSEHQPSDPSLSLRPEKKLKWAIIGWGIGILLSMFLIGSMFALANIEPSDDLSIHWVLIGQTPMWIGMLSPIVLTRKYEPDWKKNLGCHVELYDVTLIPLGIAAGVFLQFVAIPLMYKPIFWIAENLGLSDIGTEQLKESAQNLIDKADSPLGLASLIFMTVVMAPLTEELFFRGLVQNSLKERFTPIIAVSVASFIFALIHFQILQFPGLLLVGTVCGLMLQISKRLSIAISCHMAFNATTLVLLL